MNPFIPPKTIAKMKELGIVESTLLDLFHHGERRNATIDQGMMVKKYSGYEVGLFYVRNAKTGEYVITGVWKRDRA
ncbi:hypothetical protein HY468_01295 [Candidatus Roizmanbacteria bacterium]|nr:hypothetical protein [Candidatus Roizmanbacteria bacterium]